MFFLVHNTFLCSCCAFISSSGRGGRGGGRGGQGGGGGGRGGPFGGRGGGRGGGGGQKRNREDSAGK